VLAVLSPSCNAQHQNGGDGCENQNVFRLLALSRDRLDHKGVAASGM